MDTKEKNDQKMITLAEIFPSVDSIFFRTPIKQKDLLDKSVFVLDTNTLLAPFNLGKDSLEEIKSVYIRLVKEKRILIPSQCIREFAKNRPVKIKDLHSQVYSLLSSIPNINYISCPLLENIEAYQNLKEIKNNISKLLKDYKSNLKDLKQEIAGWNWNDPVSTIYSEIFSPDIVIDHELSEEDITIDAKRRFDSDTPPGYKDKSKTINSTGDIVIWHSILAFAKMNKTHVVFVSNDEKPDWVVRDNKESIATRYELIDEFYRETDGCEFTCINFSSFMEINGAKEETITEIKEREIENTAINILGTNHNFQGNSLTILTSIADIISEFLNKGLPMGIPYITGDTLPDLITEFGDLLHDEMKETPVWRAIFPYLHKIELILKEIESNNFTIHYQEVRMKRSASVEEIELKALAEEFLKIYTEINGLISLEA